MKACIQDGHLVFYCPGCDLNHRIPVNNLNPSYAIQWEFNDDLNFPTLTEDVKHIWEEKGVKKICHYHIENGNIRYVNDGTTHRDAGKTIELRQL